MSLGKLGRAIAVPFLAVAALYCFYMWIFHGWAASGPPTEYPEIHRALSVRFLVGGLALLAVLGIVLWRRKRGAPRADSSGT